VVEGQSFAQVALVLHVHDKTVATWVRLFCCASPQGAPRQKPTGRPPTLTPTQKVALAPRIDEGPEDGVQRRLLAFAHDPAADL
jgi:transposase